MTAAPHDHARRAYQAMASVYDVFTAGHDYDGWTRTLEQAAVEAGLRGRRQLDVACGTGKSFLPFLERGYDVTACDISPRMVALAAAKAGPRARLAVHDMRELPALGEFDLITCLDDALNYLLERRELVAALRGMRRNLAPDGVVVADVNTLATYRGFFATLDVIAEEARVLVWRGGGSPRVRAGERVDAALEVLARPDDGAWRSAIHTHRQRHHPAAAMRTALAAAGLEPVAIRGVTPDGVLHERADELAHTKVIYIARGAG